MPRLSTRSCRGCSSSALASACSSTAASGGFTISAAPVAGSVPDGAAGPPLLVTPGAGGAVTLGWGASCSPTVEDYAVYEGDLDALAAGSWDHLPVACNAGTDRSETFGPGAGSRYFLVAPQAGGAEGSLGSGSSGDPRPAAPEPRL